MSRFHASIRDLFEDVHHFLVHTLKKEILSSSSLIHREKLLSKLTSFLKEYPEMQLKFSEVTEERNVPNKTDSNIHRTSSSVPYVDMNGGSSFRIPLYFQNPASDDSYHVPIIREKFESLSFAESDDYGSDDVKNLPYVSAADLARCDKAGYLDKKKRETIKGWLNPFQRRWCAIKNGALYYYDKTTDRKQRGSISLQGYEVRVVPDDNKDTKKYSHCFELVCPGKRTYQFSASSEKDLNQWTSAIERNSGAAYSSKKEKNFDSDYSSKLQAQHHSELFDDCEDDIYESVIDEIVLPEKSEAKIPQICSSKENYSDVDTPYIAEEEYSDIGTTYLAEEEYSDIGTNNFPEEEYSDIGASNFIEEEYSDIGATNVEEEEYSDIVTIMAQNDKNDYSDWYVGLWDCTGEDKSELSFSRGDVIHIISKEHDNYGWWIGELNGKKGLVPKSFLMRAYESY